VCVFCVCCFVFLFLFLCYVIVCLTFSLEACKQMYRLLEPSECQIVLFGQSVIQKKKKKKKKKL
jgi:hypothetical protein